MRSMQWLGLSLAAVFLLLSWGCSTTQAPPTPAPLSAANINLIFVVSEDLAYQAPGDVDPSTANLTSQGLQRSLLMATFLQQNVLGGKNVSGIYALEPTTHLQTASLYPDMVALETIQQFAVLNQITLPTDVGLGQFTGNSYPLNASYAPGAPLPSGVAPPLQVCSVCQGLDFGDQGGDNENLVTTIMEESVPGFYVFSAPWETVSSLMANINQLTGYNLTLPASYQGPNYIYAIAIAPSGASLATYNSNLNPPSTYPTLPWRNQFNTPCKTPTFHIAVTGGSGGAVIPPNTNVNETLYMVRHAEAHPTNFWEDGNYVAAGQWRALYLPNALQGKINPNQVYSIDPAQVIPTTHSAWSYARPSLTVEPYAIANNLPYNLVTSFELFAPNSPQQTSNFFFTGGQFNNQTVLMAWEHDHIPPTVNALIASYNGSGPAAPDWPGDDYDTIWTVTLDATGNLTVDNSLCEGINSAALPATAPQF